LVSVTLPGNYSVPFLICFVGTKVERHRSFGFV
jgi:hypothetical protein